MTATLIGKSDLLFFVSNISTGQTGRAFHFAPLPLTPTISLRVQCDPYRHPTGRISFLCLHPPCTPLYLSLLAHHCPLNLFYVITWHQSYLLTLIRGKIEPTYSLNMAYLMYTSTWIYKLPIQLYLTYVKFSVSIIWSWNNFKVWCLWISLFIRPK